MYSFDSRVRYSETDETGKLTVLGLINYMQDCSTFHSADVGVGVEVLEARHKARPQQTPPTARVRPPPPLSFRLTPGEDSCLRSKKKITGSSTAPPRKERRQLKVKGPA